MSQNTCSRPTSRTAGRCIQFNVYVIAVMFCALSGNAHAGTVTPTADGWVNRAAPTATGSATTPLKVQNGAMIAYIRFAQSALPSRAGGTAKLAVYVSSLKTAGPVSAYLVLSNWQESAVTWNTQPQLASAPLNAQPISLAMVGGWVEFDVAAAVNTWINNPAANFGIALVGAPTPRTYAFFGSKELGAGATLTTVGPAPNAVTVAKTGGDYTDPVVAANNAFNGDTWCVAPQLPANPCRMTIGAGIFVLSQTLVLRPELVVVGSGTTATTLLAKKGLATAVQSAAISISDLSIVNQQDGVSRVVGLLHGGQWDNLAAVSRVSVLAAGGQTNVALQWDGEGPVSNSEFTASGGQDSVGTQGSLVLSDSSVAAVGGSRSNTAVDADGNVAYLTGVRLTATGGTSAVGVVSGIDELNFGSVAGSEIDVSSSGTAIGVTGSGAELTVSVMGTRIRAMGSTQGVGVVYGREYGGIWLDDVDIQASHVGVSVGSDGLPYASLDLNRSTVSAGVSAIHAADSELAQVRVSTSMLRGSEWLTASAGSGVITVSDSVLDGSAQYAGTVTCQRNYDRTYNLLASTCPAP